jgi:hypothetical protein
MIKLAFATWLVACVGCISFETSGNAGSDQAFRLEFKEWTTAIDAAKAADDAAGRTLGAEEVTAFYTMSYWMGLKKALHPAPIDSGIAARVIGNLQTRGVDPALLREGQLAAEKMQAAANPIKSMPVYTILFQLPHSRWLEAEALGKAAMEQCYLVEKMRPELSARYGVEFPPLDVTKREIPREIP